MSSARTSAFASFSEKRSPSAGTRTATGPSGFNGLGVLVAILCIAVIVWEGMLAAGVTINTGASSPALIGAALAAATALVTIIAFLTKLDAIKWGAFVGLILALVMTYGAYLRFQESRAGGMSPPPAA